MNFVGKGIKLTSDDINNAAKLIGVGEDEIHAVIDVETAGSGFDAHGRPRMLFEPAYFYKLCPADKLNEAVRKGIAYKSYGQKPYPKDSYPSLTSAMAIDEDAALRSASWGLGQLMGANYKVAGYDSVKAMVLAFIDSEAAQLDGMVDFIKGNHLAVALKTHNWVTFAASYNGPRYGSNHYDTKLQAAYEKWRKIPDTALAAHPTAPEKVSRVAATVTDPPAKTASAVTAMGLGDRLRMWLSFL